MPVARTTNETRTRILEAAITIWSEEAPAVLFGGLSVARVSKVAGVTRSTFYSYWPTTEEYLQDALGHLADRVEGMEVARTVDSIANDAPRSAEMVDRFLTGSNLLCEAIAGDPGHRLMLAFVSKDNDPAVAPRLREIYRQTEDRIFSTFGAVLESWGREPRPPFDSRRILAVLTALAEGLGTRFSFDPEAAPLETYGHASLAFLMVATRQIDDSRDLQAAFDTANNWPSIGLALRLKEQTKDSEIAAHARSTSLSPREVVIAARRMLTRTSYTELTFAELAAVTRVSEVTLQQWFGSKAGLGTALYMLNIGEHYDAIDPGLPAIDRLRTMIDLNIAEVDRWPVLSQSILLLLAGATTMPRIDLVDWDPRPVMIEAIREAMADGDLDPTMDPNQFSAMLQRIITIDKTPPGSLQSPDINAAELVLLGAGAPPRKG